MKPHQERVVEERNVLNDKISALAAFLAKVQDGQFEVESSEQDRLATQLVIMQAYSNILNMRIKEFK
jgi:hypothetical protein